MTMTRDEALRLEAMEVVMTLGLAIGRRGLAGQPIDQAWLGGTCEGAALALAERLDEFLPLDGADLVIVANSLLFMLMATCVTTAAACAPRTSPAPPVDG